MSDINEFFFGSNVNIKDEDGDHLVIARSGEYLSVATQLPCDRENDFTYSVRSIHYSKVEFA